MMQNLAPLALFVYNRPQHTRMTLESLKENYLADQTHLYIFADGHKQATNTEEILKIREVREIIRAEAWCGIVDIFEFADNQGLAQNIVQGINYVLGFHDKIIVLEDDLLLSKGFLRYMNEALDVYQEEERVMHISGYKFPVGSNSLKLFFFNVPSSWGWATWKRAWKAYESDPNTLYDALKCHHKLRTFDLEGSRFFLNHLKANMTLQINTWAIKWYAVICLKEGFCLYPGTSLVQNIGFDQSGTHCSSSQVYTVDQLAESIPVEKIPLKEHTVFRKKMKLFYRYEGILLKHQLRYYHNLMKAFLYKFIPLGLKNIYKRLKYKFSN
ncbi:MAG: glycosyltransferase family A protein [Microscillaceae bacterium]|nr:glycosyltransferase family A protein [Microscillaceae bacterium]